MLADDDDKFAFFYAGPDRDASMIAEAHLDLSFLDRRTAGHDGENEWFIPRMDKCILGQAPIEGCAERHLFKDNLRLLQLSRR